MTTATGNGYYWLSYAVSGRLSGFGFHTEKRGSRFKNPRKKDNGERSNKKTKREGVGL